MASFSMITTIPGDDKETLFISIPNFRGTLRTFRFHISRRMVRAYYNLDHNGEPTVYLQEWNDDTEPPITTHPIACEVTP